MIDDVDDDRERLLKAILWKLNRQSVYPSAAAAARTSDQGDYMESSEKHYFEKQKKKRTY